MASLVQNRAIAQEHAVPAIIPGEDTGLEACSRGFGHGERNRFASLAPSAELRKICPSFLLNDQHGVLLSPEGRLPHPLLRYLAPVDSYSPRLYRGFIDGRSFHAGLNDAAGTAWSLVVKGDLNQDGIRGHLDKEPVNHIPGLCHVKENTREFDRTEELLSLCARREPALLGALPVPLRVQSIQSVLDSEGRAVRIDDFFNGDGYAPQCLRLSALRRVQAETNVAADNLAECFASQGLTPSQYLYLIRGSNLRVSELVECLMFPHDSAFEMSDLIYTPRGEELLRSGLSRGRVVRAAFRALACHSGFNIDRQLELVPDNPRDDLRRVLNKLRAELNKISVCSWRSRQPLTLALFNAFLEPLIDATALVHASGYTFSKTKPGCRGSLTPRNVTIGPVILDLGTVARQTEAPAGALAADFQDLLISAAFMRRLLFDKCPWGLCRNIRERYLSRVSEIDYSYTGAAEAASTKNNCVTRNAMNCL